MNSNSAWMAALGRSGPETQAAALFEFAFDCAIGHQQFFTLFLEALACMTFVL